MRGRRARAFARGVLALLLAAAPALAWFPPSPAQNILVGASSSADLRAKLRAHADSATALPLDAGEAWYYLGQSFRRAGLADSATFAHRRGLLLRNDRDDVLAMADALLDGPGAAEAESALALLTPLLRASGNDPRAQGAAVRLRVAWARARTGDPAAAATVWTAPRGDLANPKLVLADQALWAARFAPIAMDAGDRDAAWTLLAPLAVLSRGAEPRLLALAREAAAGRVASGTFETFLAATIARADSLERAVFGGARPFSVRAEDGFTLRGGAWPAGRGAPLAFVLPPPEPATLAEWDSLAVQLHRGGIAVVWIDPRGSRGSAGPGAALPGAWRGREDERTRRWARDVALTLGPAAVVTGADARRIVLIGAGTSVLPTALAAADPRVRGVVLAGPAPAPVERGWLRETLAASRVPVFVQTGPEDVYGNETTDRIVAGLAMGQVRVADSQSRGFGVELFRAGPAVGKRLTDWIRDLWSTPRATRPSPRR